MLLSMKAPITSTFKKLRKHKKNSERCAKIYSYFLKAIYNRTNNRAQFSMIQTKYLHIVQKYKKK
jgi:hypothetical protein